MNVQPQRKHFLTRALTCLGVGLIMMSPANVRADFVDGFVGNSQFANSPNISDPIELVNSDGIVNFAVYQTIDSDWTDDFDIAPDTTIHDAMSELSGGGTIDTQTQTVFFFQIVNTDPNPVGGYTDATVHEFKVPIGTTAGFSSIGYIDGYVFQELSGAVGPTGNARLGAFADTTTLSDDTAGDGSPSEDDALLADDPFVINASANNPDSASLTDFGYPTSFATVSVTLTAGQYSSVFFMTLDSDDFSYAAGSLRNGTEPTLADVPTPLSAEGSLGVPEPAAATSLAMLLFSALGVYGFARRRGLTKLLIN